MNKVKLIEPYVCYESCEVEMKEIFSSGWLTKGPHVQRFREELQKTTGAKYAHLATSATTALSLCLKLIGIKEGDEVAISDFSFPATANVVEDLGATPVFIDVRPETYNMDPALLKKGITGKTKAVIFVDAFGNPSGIGECKKICAEFNLPLIEDAACAIGSVSASGKVGEVADLTCFSFHPRKLLTTGEGGAITTNSDEYHELLEIKLNHGAKGMKGAGLDFVDCGFNYRMSEIQALMGWKQLLQLNSIIESRQKMFEAYENALSPLGFKAQDVSADVSHNVQSVVFTVPEECDRNALIAHLSESNIESTLGTYCLSGTSYYENKYSNVQAVSSSLEDTTITLPCHDNVDVDVVVQAIQNYPGLR